MLVYHPEKVPVKMYGMMHDSLILQNKPCPFLLLNQYLIALYKGFIIKGPDIVPGLMGGVFRLGTPA